MTLDGVGVRNSVAPQMPVPVSLRLPESHLPVPVMMVLAAAAEEDPPTNADTENLDPVVIVPQLLPGTREAVIEPGAAGIEVASTPWAKDSRGERIDGCDRVGGAAAPASMSCYINPWHEYAMLCYPL